MVAEMCANDGRWPTNSLKVLQGEHCKYREKEMILDINFIVCSYSMFKTNSANRSHLIKKRLEKINCKTVFSNFKSHSFDYKLI